MPGTRPLRIAVILLLLGGCAAARPDPTPDFTAADWDEIARIVAANWVRDLADDLDHAAATGAPGARVPAAAVLADAAAYWAALGGPPGSLLDRTLLEGQPRARLEGMARWLRLACIPLTAAGLLQQFPKPAHAPAPSRTPFGDALTVFRPGVGRDVLEAFFLQLPYADTALRLDEAADAHRPITAALLHAYRVAQDGVRPVDYRILARHQVAGLEAFWGHPGFDRQRFADGMWALTVAGEWEFSRHSEARWLKWIDAWQGICATGAVPDLVAPGELVPTAP